MTLVGFEPTIYSLEGCRDIQATLQGRYNKEIDKYF